MRMNEKFDSDRRRFLQSIGVVGLTSLAAGCLGDDDTDDTDDTEDDSAFQISELSVIPEEVDEADTFDVSVTIVNEGEETGTQDLTLVIDGTTVATESVTVDGGESKEVTFVGNDPTGLPVGETINIGMTTEDDESQATILVEAAVSEDILLIRSGERETIQETPTYARIEVKSTGQLALESGAQIRLTT